MAETNEDEDPTIYLGTFIEICSRHGLFDKHKRASAPYRRVTEEALVLLNWPNFDGELQWSSARKDREKYRQSYVKMYNLYRNKYRLAKDEEKAALLEEWNGQPFISTALYETLFGKPKREKGKGKSVKTTVKKESEDEEVAGAASLPEPTKATAEVSKSLNISKTETSFKNLSTPSTSAAAKYDFRKLSQSLTQEDEFDDDECTPIFPRVYITRENNTGVPMEDLQSASKPLSQAMEIRRKYMKFSRQKFPTIVESFLKGAKGFPEEVHIEPEKATLEDTPIHPAKSNNNPWNCAFLPNLEDYTFRPVEGVFQVYRNSADADAGKIAEGYDYPDLDTYVSDMHKMCALIVDGPLKSFCYRRLTYLSSKFQLHVLLNELRELAAQKAVAHRDFYNVRKVKFLYTYFVDLFKGKKIQKQ